MAFKPINANKSQGEREFTGNFPTPRGGSRKARISLIVDLGIQEREPLYKVPGSEQVVFADTPGAEEVTQNDCQQLAVFADLVADTVDYGGNIGKQHYRLLLNKSFAGKVNGINFAPSPPIDPKGKIIKGKPWGFHPQSILTKLAKAMDKEEVITSMDVEQLLDTPFMADVDVRETEDKDGKLDKDGDVIVYKNVNYKGSAKVPEDDDGKPLPVAALNCEAKCVTFDNATKEDILFIRPNIRKMIKLATNYAGSKMEEAIQAFEAEQEEQAPEQEEPKPKAQKAAINPVAPKKPVKPAIDRMDDDVPF